MAGSITTKMELTGEKEYQNTLKDIIAQSKSLASEMKALESGFAANGNAQEQAASKAELLNRQIQVQTQYIDQLKSKMATLDPASREAFSQQDKINKAIASLNKMQAELDKIPNKWQNIGKAMQDAGSKMESIGSVLTKTVSVPIASIMAASTKLAADFEQGMAKVSTIADTSQVSMADMSKQIIQLSDDTGVAATDLSESVYQAISAGQDTKDAVGFVTSATKLMKAGFTDSATATDTLTTILNAYGMKASEVTSVSDKLITTQNLGKTSVAQLGASMGKIIPTAAMFGVNLDQLASAYVATTKNGISTAESTTYLNSMLNELGKSGTTASKALTEATGKTFSQLMESGVSLIDVVGVLDQQAQASGKSIADMFGSQEAGKAASTLVQHANDFNSAMTAMGESAGATEEAYGKVMDTAAEKAQKAINNIKNAGISIGQSLLPIASDAMGKVADVAKQIGDAYAKLSPAQQDFVTKLALTAAAAGPVISVAGKITTGVGKVVEGVGNLKKAMDGVKDVPQVFQTVASAIEKVKSALESLPSNLGSLGSLIKGGFSGLGAGSVAVGGGVVAALAAMGVAFDNIKNKYDEANDSSAKVRDSVSSITDATNKTTESLRQLADGFGASSTEIDESTERMRSLAEEYDKLASTNVDGSNLMRMKDVAAELVGVFPEMEGALDSTSGLFETGAQSVSEYADQLEKAAQISTLSAQLKYVGNALGEANANVDKQKQALSDMGNAYMESSDKASTALDKFKSAGVDATGNVKGNVLELQQATKQATDDQNAFNEAFDGLQDAENVASDLQDKYDGIQSKIDELKGSTDAANESLSQTGESSEGIDNAGQSAEEASQKMQEFQSAVQSAYNSIDAFSGWDIETMGIGQMRENLDAQIEGLQNYTANLGTVQTAMQGWDAQAQAGASEFLQTVSSMGVEGAGYLQGLVDAINNGGTEARDYLARFAEMSDAKAAMATSAAELSTGIQSAGDQAAQAAADATQKVNDTVAQSAEQAGESVKQSAQNAVNDAASSTDTSAMQQVGQQAAQSVGEGAASSTDTVSTAITTALSSAAAQASGNAGAFTAAGQQLGMALSTGIASIGPGAAIAAVQTVVNAAASAANGATGQLQAAGVAGGTAYASGLSSTAGGSSAAATSVATGAGTALNAGAALAMVAGTMTGSQYAGGISSQSGAASGAGSALVSAAAGAMHGGYGAAFSAGSYMGSGLAAGINSQVGAVQAAAARLAAAASAAIAAKAKIHSPSKVEIEHGKYIGQGLAIGIASETSEVAGAAENLAQEVIDTTTLGGKKVYDKVDGVLSSIYSKVAKSSDKTGTTTKALWNTALREAKRGTESYSNVVAKAGDDTEKHWKEVLDNAKEELNRYQLYHDDSLAYEVDYWNKIRKTIQTGTSARYTADKNYFDKYKSLISKMQSLQEKYVDKVQSIQSKLADSIQDIADDITGQLSILDYFEAKESPSAAQLIANMQTQADATAAFTAALDKLRSRADVPESLMKEFEKLDISDAAAIDTVASMNDDQLRQYVDAYKRATVSAQAEAEAQSAPLRQQAIKDIADATADYVEDIKEQGITATNDMLATGAEAIQNILNGMPNAMANFATGLDETKVEIEYSIKDIGDTMLKLADDPGYYAWGSDAAAQFAEGLRSQVANVKQAALEVAEAAGEYIHHSSPKVGPLAGDDKWGAEMIGNFAAGMVSQVPLVQRASMQAATAAAFSASASARMSGAAGNSSNYNYGGFNIVINAAAGQSPQAIAEEVERRIARNAQRRRAVTA